MSSNSRVVAVMVAVMALLPFVAAPAAADQQSVDVIVVLHDVASPNEVARDHRVVPTFLYEHVLTGFAASVPEGRLQGLRNDPRVDFVSDDRPVHAVAQTDPTGVARIDAPKAHGAATGSGIRVAIIDTGIDSDHPDLKGNLDWASGYDCINDDADPEDDQGHGTHVAGTVAAVNNEQGVLGVAPGAKLVAFKVLDSSGSGSWSSVICGIDRAAALNADGDAGNNIDVANMSLGGSGSLDGDCKTTTDALYQAICDAVVPVDPAVEGIAFTVAAGNDSQDAANFVPAAYPEVITVSAYADTDGTVANAGCTGIGVWKTCDEQFASFSNYGAIVDVIAPGVNILSTTYKGDYGEKSGTSMAAPHVAGVAALVLQKSTLTPAQLETHLRDTGQCPDDQQNIGTGYCGDQGVWDEDLDSLTEPMVNALWATPTDGDTNSPPTASFTYTCTDLDCTFEGSGSSDSGGSISSYEWNFGDGSAASGVTASHRYAEGGTYTVKLTVTDNDGATDTSSQAVTVSSGTEEGITLSATGYKVKGRQHADLEWSGTDRAGDVDVYLNGSWHTATADDGFYTHSTSNVGGGSYTYQVCEAGTSTCSNEANVTF